MTPFWKAIKPILFSLDAETAHHFACRMMPLAPFSVPNLGPDQRIRVWEMRFRSRVGLAAGFDKNATVLPYLPKFGFGFAEVGTVTPRPQMGNPRPRLFRDTSKELLFNRMGFNNDGAPVVADRVRHAREGLPEDFRVGINLGKNRDTPLDHAWKDYAEAVGAFRDLVDYIVVNVSSPNTEGLRSLQTVDSLRSIVGEVKNRIGNWKILPPLLLKLAPEVFELPEADVETLAGSASEFGIDGWVLTNTLAGEFFVDSDDEKQKKNVSGGWSGKILSNHSRRSIEVMRKFSELPVVSVGGIDSPEEARARIDLGAQLVQIYTSWIYRGPRFPKELSEALSI